MTVPSLLIYSVQLFEMQLCLMCSNVNFLIIILLQKERRERYLARQQIEGVDSV